MVPISWGPCEDSMSNIYKTPGVLLGPGGFLWQCAIVTVTNEDLSLTRDRTRTRTKTWLPSLFLHPLPSFLPKERRKELFWHPERTGKSLMENDSLKSWELDTLGARDYKDLLYFLCFSLPSGVIKYGERGQFRDTQICRTLECNRGTHQLGWL